MPRDWRSAYFQQALSDYTVFKLLNAQEHNVAFCHRLHYLQMTTEKLAKGFLSPSDGTAPARVHYAFARFLQSVKGTPRLRRLCDCGSSQFKAYIDSLLPVAKDIEDLAPVGDKDKPNPEYPWEEQTTAGISVTVPAEYAFAILDFKNPKMIKMLSFIDRCFQLIEGDE